VVHATGVLEIVQSATFSKWLSKLADRRARSRVLVRVDRLAAGNPGDAKPVGGGLSEMRIDYGPGYRVYFMQRGNVAVLLCGGDKDTQDADIKRAREIAKDWEAAPVVAPPATSPVRRPKATKGRKGARRPKE
jgi:putative addiction module killer protein